MGNIGESTRRFMAHWTRAEPRVFAYIFTMLPNWADAEDVLQETSVVLWQKLDQFEEGTDFVRWATRVAHFEVQKYRQRRRLTGLPFDDAFLDMLAARMDKHGDELSHLTGALESCMGRLKESDRRLIRLRYTDGASVASTASALGASVDAVYKSLQRVRRDLFGCIRRGLRREEHA